MISKSQTAITPKGLINPSFGLNGGDANAVTCVTADDYIYAGGSFNNTIDFDLTADTFNLSSTFGYNIFIAKYDKQLKLVFAFKLSGLSGFDGVQANATDSNDNMYIAGYFQGTLDFDPGPNVSELTTQPYVYDLFFAKYDKNGNLIFARQIAYSANNNTSQITSLKIDAYSNIFIGGYGRPQNLDFDPGPKVAHAQSHGKDDAFFAKYDAAGNYVFAKAVGGSLDDDCASLVLNKNSNIIITGSFADADNDFDPDAGKVTLSYQGGYDAFVGIYDSYGNYKYAFSLGGVQDDFGNGLTTGKDSSIIVSGSFYGNVDFSPDSNVVAKISDSDNDCYLAKYTNAGKLVFVTSVNATAPYVPTIAVDDDNNIFISGSFAKVVSFTPTDSLVSRGKNDIFWAKYNAKGIFKFSNQVGGTNYDGVSNISLVNDRYLLVSGSLSDTCYFNDTKTRKLSAVNAVPYIALYNVINSNNVSANAFGTYRTFNVESSVVKFAHDEQNNTYVAGSFQGIVDFDPTIRQYFLTSSQDAASAVFLAEYNDDIFFAKYNANGKLVFAKDIGGSKGQGPVSIAVDANYNIYLCGGFLGTIDVDPGEDSVIFYRKYNTSAYNAFFIAKYDSSGNYIFAQPLYINGDLNAMTIDKHNNLYIAGSFFSGYFNFTDDTSEIFAEGRDIFFAKYTSNGKFSYLKSIGQKNVYQPYYACADMLINSKGNIVLCGTITGSQVDFDPGPNTYYVNTGSRYVHFAASYTTVGNFLFEANSIALNSSSSITARLIKTDNNGNTIVAGNYTGNVQFSEGIDSVFTVPNNISSVFFIKYNTTGKPVFVKTFSVTKPYGSLDIACAATDYESNIFISGQFSGKVDFDPSDDTAFLKSDNSMHSNNNIFLAKYDLSGNYEYAYNFVPTDTAFSRGAYTPDLYVNKNSDITLAVNTNGKIDFYPGPDTLYYYPPFNVYPSLNQSFSFVLVKFKQTQTVKSFNIYASLLKSNSNRLTRYLDWFGKYLNKVLYRF